MDDTKFDMRSLRGLLRRQLRLIVIITMVVVGIAALTVFSLTPKYSASAMLQFDTSQKRLHDPSSTSTGGEIDSPRVDSEIEILSSPSVLLKVIADLRLVRDVPEADPAQPRYAAANSESGPSGLLLCSGDGQA